MSLGESNGVQSILRSSFMEDGNTVYNPMMQHQQQLSSPPPSYQISEPPVAAAAPPHLNPSLAEPGKKKRGRPRKYAPDGSAMVAPPPPPPQSAAGSLSPPPEISPAPKKKGRGRPAGSGRKHQLAVNSASAAALGSTGAGFGFKPHVITIKAGEDVQAKLMSFSQSTSQAICILSANGAISNVTLRQPATSGGTVTYEGRFEILSLAGSFLLAELVGGQRSRTGGLSVSLSGPDGHVLGGCVAGLLTAASPVQVIIGSFGIEVQQLLKAGQCEGLANPGNIHISGASSARSPPSFGTLSASSGGGGPVSPHNHHLEASNNSPPGVASMPWR